MNRFFAKTQIDPVTGCWEWTAARDAKGYGRFGLDGKNRKAARVAYEMLVGPILDGLVPDHLCRNRGCVNPKHLELVTPAENTRRGFAARGRQTHCREGHLLEGENVIETADQRRCRTCRNAYMRAWRAAS